MAVVNTARDEAAAAEEQLEQERESRQAAEYDVEQLRQQLLQLQEARERATAQERAPQQKAGGRRSPQGAAAAGAAAGGGGGNGNGSSGGGEGVVSGGGGSVGGKKVAMMSTEVGEVERLVVPVGVAASGAEGETKRGRRRGGGVKPKAKGFGK